MTAPSPFGSQRILLAGGTGYIGRVVVTELCRRGHRIVSLVRAGSAGAARHLAEMGEVRVADVSAPESPCGADDTFDTVVSCLASRTGVGADAWKVDYQANVNLLAAARGAGARRFVLLSALCVQNPQLEFQRAKLAFETALAESGLGYAIVRPSAFFKSLAGQIPRLRAGKPFVLFGNDAGPPCKPISERDLARFIADCVEVPAHHEGVLAIGGPGPAVTPLDRGELLFRMLGRPPRYRRIPLALFDAITAALAPLARFSTPVAARQELARIGRFYATEPMLVRDPVSGAYSAEATPTYGEDTLEAFYAKALAEGLSGQQLGNQALF